MKRTVAPRQRPARASRSSSCSSWSGSSRSWRRSRSRDRRGTSATTRSGAPRSEVAGEIKAARNKAIDEERQLRRGLRASRARRPISTCRGRPDRRRGRRGAMPLAEPTTATEPGPRSRPLRSCPWASASGTTCTVRRPSPPKTGFRFNRLGGWCDPDDRPRPARAPGAAGRRGGVEPRLARRSRRVRHLR